MHARAGRGEQMPRPRRIAVAAIEADEGGGSAVWHRDLSNGPRRRRGTTTAGARVPQRHDGAGRCRDERQFLRVARDARRALCPGTAALEGREREGLVVRGEGAAPARLARVRIEAHHLARRRPRVEEGAVSPARQAVAARALAEARPAPQLLPALAMRTTGRLERPVRAAEEGAALVGGERHRPAPVEQPHRNERSLRDAAPARRAAVVAELGERLEAEEARGVAHRHPLGCRARVAAHELARRAQARKSAAAARIPQTQQLAVVHAHAAAARQADVVHLRQRQLVQTRAPPAEQQRLALEAGSARGAAIPLGCFDGRGRLAAKYLHVCGLPEAWRRRDSAQHRRAAGKRTQGGDVGHAQDDEPEVRRKLVVQRGLGRVLHAVLVVTARWRCGGSVHRGGIRSVHRGGIRNAVGCGQASTGHRDSSSSLATLATLLDSFTHLLGARLGSSPRLPGLPAEIRSRWRQGMDLVLTVRR